MRWIIPQKYNHAMINPINFLKERDFLHKSDLIVDR